MEHKIATLEVFVSDVDNGNSSHLDYNDEARGRYKIVLNPNFYGQVNRLEKRSPWEGFAHELGHFLARLAKFPSTHPAFRMLYGQVPNEMDAWRVAHEIMPEVPTPWPQEKAAIGLYRKHGQ